MRTLDVVISALVLAMLAPLLVVLMVVVRATSRGPALFRQTRLGLGKQPFTMYKFRTMYVDADDAAHRAYVTQLLTHPEPADGGERGVYKLAHDPRVTPIGRFLRRTSLDELPQLINVLRGDMSLVGPRPALPWEAQLYEPWQEQRFEVRPGITGLWQVSGRSNMGMREALELDVEYVRRRSVALDLRILAKTVPTVLGAGSSR